MSSNLRLQYQDQILPCELGTGEGPLLLSCPELLLRFPVDGGLIPPPPVEMREVGVGMDLPPPPDESLLFMVGIREPPVSEDELRALLEPG